MSVYVGIDVHRKRSQVAVVTEEGTVRVNRNVPNGVAPILKVIGDLPTGHGPQFTKPVQLGQAIAAAIG